MYLKHAWLLCGAVDSELTELEAVQCLQMSPEHDRAKPKCIDNLPTHQMSICLIDPSLAKGNLSAINSIQISLICPICHLTILEQFSPCKSLKSL